MWLEAYKIMHIMENVGREFFPCLITLEPRVVCLSWISCQSETAPCGIHCPKMWQWPLAWIALKRDWTYSERVSLTMAVKCRGWWTSRLRGSRFSGGQLLESNTKMKLLPSCCACGLLRGRWWAIVETVCWPNGPLIWSSRAAPVMLQCTANAEGWAIWVNLKALRCFP